MKAYKFRVLEPISDGKFTTFEGCRNAIFLAGPCPRTDFSDDWRFQAFDILDKLGFAGTVITPSNKDYQKYASAAKDGQDTTYLMQVEWERMAMHIASAIVFWIPRDKEHPGLTTNVEFGEWYQRPRTYVGFPDIAEHVRYLKTKRHEHGLPVFDDLEIMLNAAVNDLQDSEPTQYFTADTHFKQKRTLELSRRPFDSVQEMDLTMISNWNKRVTMNDIVYHAGDFIDPEHVAELPDLLSKLNFRELHWTPGNYDRKIMTEIRNAVEEHNSKSADRVIQLYDSGNCRVMGPKHSFVIVHEPAEVQVDLDPKDVVLFGHIHGRSFAKRNGFDLATDYHNYSPISMEQVEWFANAMQYWDENVYTDVVKKGALSR